MTDSTLLTSPVTAAFVRDDILAAFDVKRSRRADWQVSGPVRTTRNCWVFKAWAANYSKAVAVKIFRSADWQDTLLGQFEQLQRYHAGMPGGRGLSVPEALDVQPQHRALLMEWIDGMALYRVLLSRDLSALSRSRRIAQSGAWLRAFHEVSGIEPRAFDGKRMLVHTDRPIDRLPGTVMASRQGRRLLAARDVLGRLCERFHGLEAAHAVIHSDMTTSNLIVRDGQLVGLDFDARRRWPVVSDICRFLVYADVTKWLLTPQTAMDDTAGDRRDLAAFKAGYGAEAFPGEGLLGFVLLNEVTRRIAIRSNPETASGVGAWRHVELFRLNRRCRRLAATLQQQLQTGSPQAAR